MRSPSASTIHRPLASMLAAAVVVAGLPVSAAPRAGAAAPANARATSMATAQAAKGATGPATTRVTPTPAKPTTPVKQPVKQPTATTRAATAPYGRQGDGTYLGKGGFRLDLGRCPRDYDPMQGITATEVKAFVSLPRSGPQGGFGLIADGMTSYFRYVNEHGGVAGRRITLDAKDDLYLPDRTKANVTEAVASGRYAALVATFGTPNNLAVWDETNKECMPHLLSATGAVQWGDVDGHPWTTGMQLDYATEAILWAKYIKQQFPRGARVAMLTFNSDFGRSYSRGFRMATKGTNISVVDEELHEPSAPNLTNQFTNIEAALPDVVLVQTTGVFCTQSMAEVEKRAYKGMVLVSATCAALSQFFGPLIEQGLTGRDTYMVNYWKDVNDREFADDPFVKLFHSTLKAQGLDDKQSTYANGWIFAWYFVEILKLAATYQGGLSRPNIMLASRSLERTMPLALPGVTHRMDGMNDAYMNESARMTRYKVTDPKQLGSFFAQGPVISNEGGLGTYRRVMAQG